MLALGEGHVALSAQRLSLTAPQSSGFMDLATAAGPAPRVPSSPADSDCQEEIGHQARGSRAFGGRSTPCVISAWVSHQI